MALPLPPTPLDAEKPYLPEFRKVRRDRNELRNRYQFELANLERNGRISPVEEVNEYDLGFFGGVIRWEHLRTTNRIRSVGVQRDATPEFYVPRSDTDTLRQAVRRVVWAIRLANAVNVAVQLLGVLAVVTLVLLVFGLP